MFLPIYELSTDNAYVGVTFVDENNFVHPIEKRMKTLRRRGSSFAVMFDSRRVKPATVKVPDFVRFIPGFCCFRSSAWSLLKKNLRLKGPTVRLAFQEAGRKLDFILFEPSPEFDCVNFTRSNVRYFDESQRRVMWVDDLVLKNVSGVDQDIFRVEHMTTRLFCTEECVDLVAKHKLTGFEFHRVPASS